MTGADIIESLAVIFGIVAAAAFITLGVVRLGRTGPIRFIRTLIARRKLARLVAERRASFEIQDYRKRRAAALKGRRACA